MGSDATGGAAKTVAGHFFEDFHVGMVLRHATPRTVTEGDVSLYTALYGGRFAMPSSTPFAQHMGLPRAPVDSLLAFHVVFGKTVPDVSLNAIANLGYADCRFGVPLYPGDTVTTTTTVTGVKANRDGQTGVVWVRSEGVNQHGERVVGFDRWVMVRKRDPSSPAPETVIPELPESVDATKLHVPFTLAPGSYDTTLAGSPHVWEDYAVGERIDHVDGTTIEDAEHMLATRLWQNTAKVHFNQHQEREGRFGKRIVYGGHVISIVRALSFNGLANAQAILAINGGRHVAPAFAGDTIYAWSEVLGKLALPGREDFGALVVRTIGCKDHAPSDFPDRDAEGRYHPAVVLDLSYVVAMPRRAGVRSA